MSQEKIIYCYCFRRVRKPCRNSYADSGKTGIDSRATILGHVQRGGNPTLKDRVNATRMGYYAVKLLEEGKTNRVVALQQGNLVDYDIQEALKMKKPLDMDLYNMMMKISF